MTDDFEQPPIFDISPRQRSGGLEALTSEYLDTRNLMREFHSVYDASGEASYSREHDLWVDAIYHGKIFEWRRVYLEEFKLTEWIPLAPGLYHTKEAGISRDKARWYRAQDDERLFVPEGKFMMIAGGGIGCIRISSKNVYGEPVRFLGATSSGSAHQGFVVAVRPKLYSAIAPLLKAEGGTMCNITGEIRIMPSTDRLIPVHYESSIPRIYLLADEISIVSKSANVGELDVTAAVMFSSKELDRDGIFFTYSHFDPGSKKSLDQCVEWIRSKYVQGRYKGHVLTDFDEEVSHFPGAVLGIKTLMKQNLSSTEVVSFLHQLDRGANINFYQVERYVQVGHMNNIIVTGDGNVIGDNNRVITKINKGLDTNELRQLGEMYALLRAQVMELSTEDKVKNRALRHIENAEEESGSASPKTETIVNDLRTARNVLETAGEVFDKATGWGKRLMDIANGLKSIYPAAAPLLASLF